MFLCILERIDVGLKFDGDTRICFCVNKCSAGVMIPTWTGKMGTHFPVRERQGILPKKLEK